MFSIRVETSLGGLIAGPIARLDLVVTRTLHFFKYDKVDGIKENID
jgi:hypothetical protein